MKSIIIYIVLIDQIVNFQLQTVRCKLIYIYVYIVIYQQICCFHTLWAFWRSFKQMKKIFWGVWFYPGLWSKRDSHPCLLLTNFTIWTGRATILNVCVVYPNSMIYVPVQFKESMRFFKELSWVLALSVSLCPTPGHVTPI